MSFATLFFGFVIKNFLDPPQDMVAFSCCVYDGDEKEKQDLDAAREKGWRGKFQRPGRVIKPDAIRMNGKCPMTPLEVCVLIILEVH